MTKELTACLHGSDTCFEDPAIEMTEEQSAQSNGYALKLKWHCNINLLMSAGCMFLCKLASLHKDAYCVSMVMAAALQ